VPDGYKYYVNTTTEPSTVERTGNGSTTIINGEGEGAHKYVKIIASSSGAGNSPAIVIGLSALGGLVLLGAVLILKKRKKVAREN
jgi:hypothetical protein